MSRFSYALFTLSLCLSLASPNVHAQETVAGGNLSNEASWSALKTMVDGAKGIAQNALTLAQAIESCGKKSMIYAPGKGGPDSPCEPAVPSLPICTSTQILSTDSKGKPVCISPISPTPEIKRQGWVQGNSKLTCTKGKSIIQAMGNLTTDPNQSDCGTGGNCDHTRMNCLGETSCSHASGGKYYSMWIFCK